MNIITAKQLVHEFIRRDEEGNVDSITTALDHVDLDVKPGEFIAILGHNGSGKSTLAKHINTLLAPDEGTLWVDEMDATLPENAIPIRRSAGMVFQNPDNQIIASVVEEDVAFGPENLGVASADIRERVRTSLKSVGMSKYRNHSPNKLSGGQKQRVAIAGVVAMEPKCIVFDEPTAMLDPNGRREVIATAHKLNQKKGVTIILITHYMEEVVGADHVYVMDHGKIVMDGTPREIFSDIETCKHYRLDVPQSTLLADELRNAGLPLPKGVLTREELRDRLLDLFVDPVRRCQYYQQLNPVSFADRIPKHREYVTDKTKDIIVDHVSYEYSSGTAYRVKALDDVSLEIPRGQFVGIIGHTGSGKSTLISHLNGLLKATSGHIYVNGEDIYDEDYNIKDLRSKVGLVFQYPEHQLFETTNFKDVCFGPRNQGLDEKTVELRAFEALEQVGFPQELFDASPFDLSGGQKRRVAIAGVLAMHPEVLILDEPTAGLDPAGRDEILNLLARMHEEMKITIILVSHSMEDVAEYVDRIIVMNQGKAVYDGEPREVFKRYLELEQISLAAPQVTYLMHELQDSGMPVNPTATTVAEAAETIIAAFGA